MKKNDLSELTVNYQPVGVLEAYSSNARTHSKHQIRQIAESIRAFGFTNPILIDRNNTIIAGHGRVLRPSCWAWIRCQRFGWKV